MFVSLHRYLYIINTRELINFANETDTSQHLSNDNIMMNIGDKAPEILGKDEQGRDKYTKNY